MLPLSSQQPTSILHYQNSTSQHSPNLLFSIISSTTLHSIPNAQNLEDLGLRNCHFSGDELRSLLHVLQHLTKLQQLHLLDSTIEDLHQVAIAISNSKSLKIVELVNNDLQRAGVQAIARILTQSKTIQVLYIYDTTMGYEGAKLLCQEMMNSSIHKLAIPREYCEWIVENCPHLTPRDRVFIANPPK